MALRRADVWFKEKAKAEALKKSLEGGLRDAIVEGVAIAGIAPIAWMCFVPVEVYREHNSMTTEIWNLKRSPKIPGLKTETKYLLPAETAEGDHVVFMGIEISNPTGPPRALSDWSLSINVNGTLKSGHQKFFPKDGPNMLMYGKKVALRGPYFVLRQRWTRSQLAEPVNVGWWQVLAISL